MKLGEKQLKEIAPVYFRNLKSHLMDLMSIRDFTGEFDSINKRSNDLLTHSGISAADMIIGYEDHLLHSDIFRMTVILYACICYAVNKKSISISEMGGYIEPIKESAHISNPDELLKYFSGSISIDPVIIPDYVKTTIARNTEEREANRICQDKINLMSNPKEGQTFESYYEYAKKLAEELCVSLQKKDFMSSHSVDILASLLIMAKLGIQVPFMYSIDGSLPFPKEIVNDLSKKFYHIRVSGDNFIDLGDN